MEAAGESIPVSIRRGEAEEQLAVAREYVSQTRALISEAIDVRRAKERRLRLAEARGGEAALAERANRGRLGVLEQRLNLNEARREILADALALAERDRDGIRAKIESKIDGWKVRSEGDAKSAIKTREKYVEDTGRSPDAPRMTSADKAVDRVVRRILRSDRDMSRDELHARSGEIIDRILGGPDGRLAYDAPSGGPRIGFTGEGRCSVVRSGPASS